MIKCNLKYGKTYTSTKAIRTSCLICKTFVFFLLVSLSVSAQGQQENIEQPAPGIKLLARPYKDSILLRWAPDNSLLWEDANKCGYVLERITLTRDGAVLNNPEHKTLTPAPIVPQPLSAWEKAVHSNKYAGVAAQALYGETFDVKESGAQSLGSVITKVRERDTRFSFALFAADQSPEVAKLSGLWYTDKNVNTNEKYLYRVYLADASLKADTGTVFTGQSEYQPLPKPLDLKAGFADMKVDLSWNRRLFEHVYNAYILERSDDGGKTYQSITDEPIVNLAPTGKVSPELFYKTDSLPENNKIYHYRVRGLNSFGEMSEPSDVVSGSGHIGISFTPYITGNQTIENNAVALNWEFPAEKNNEINGFKIARSSNPKTGFKYIADKIEVESREFIDPNPMLTNYYIITAFNNFGDEVRSMPVIVQLIDSIPPDAPTELHGQVDTTGKVTLCWKPNSEEDIFGYRVYRANYATEEFSQITSSPVSDTCFYDQVSVKTLTKSVFYKIMAIDHKQNHSVFSEPVELTRPDKIPPVSPVFTSVKSSEEGVLLEWVNSTSPDVKHTALYRDLPESGEWELLAVYPVSDSTISFLDKNVDSANYRLYTLIATDETGNESKPAKPVRGKKVDRGIRKGINKIYVDINREEGNIQLAWKKTGTGVYLYQIYRAKGEGELTLFKSIPGPMGLFIDDDIQINTKYKYTIKVIYSDSSQSGFSKPVSVNY